MGGVLFPPVPPSPHPSARARLGGQVLSQRGAEQVTHPLLCGHNMSLPGVRGLGIALERPERWAGLLCFTEEGTASDASGATHRGPKAQG